MELNLEQKQNLLNALHNKALGDIQLYASGLTTLTELTASLDHVARVYGERIETLSGLLDPNTGLRFPLESGL